MKLLSLLFACTACCLARAQSITPPGLAEEESQPFSFFLVPSDEIGFKDCPQGFQLTYDGAINNGFGELDILADGRPLTNRIRTLYRGYYPILEYGASQRGIDYRVEIVGAPVRLDPRQDLIAFIRIVASNRGKGPAEGELDALYGPRGGNSRCDLPCRTWYRDQFMNAAAFASGHTDLVSYGGAVRNGHLVFLYSGSPDRAPDRLGVEYRLHLQPGQQKTILLRLPFVPVALSNIAETSAIKQMNYPATFKSVVRFWDSIFARATEIELPDPKVENTVKTSLAYDLIARDIEADGKHFTQTVNKFQYHNFFMRDTSFIAQSYDMLNLPDVARTTVEHYLVRDSSGKVTGLLHNMPDDWGQSLWALGSYLKFSGDREFAKEIEPAIKPHLDDFVKEVGSDPLGLWPVAGPYDNELLNGHYTSHDLWALLGLKEAARIAGMAGNQEDRRRALDLYAQFDKVFMERLAEITAKDSGYIPPGMDDPDKGNDWENASGGVYPFHVLPPFDPRVTATLGMERGYKFQEGIMTYGPNAWMAKQAAEAGKQLDQELHDYLTFQVTESCLAREDQQDVVADLYSVLVHTSSTNAGFECSIKPWGDRNPGGNFPPHGWFAARYNELVRNMLLREDGSDLHLASALAPHWAAPGATVRVTRAATAFGVVNLSIACQENGMEVSIDPRWRVPPAHLILHTPWFVEIRSASADGHPVHWKAKAIILPASARRVDVRWKRTSNPEMSYSKAVSLWLHKAYGRYAQDHALSAR